MAVHTRTTTAGTGPATSDFLYAEDGLTILYAEGTLDVLFAEGATLTTDVARTTTTTTPDRVLEDA